jgi:CPA2 family monovalent cation:H+ antiporter-2
VHGAVIQDLVLLYALALLFVMIGGRLRVPVIVSLIATGIIAGPGELRLVQSEENVALLSEVGIALMLFMVGLDLSFREVRRLWRRVVIGGGAQVVGTMAVTAPFVWWMMAAEVDTVILIGLFVAVSSTSIVVRELTRRNEMHAPHGVLMVGILLLQDVLALVALVLLPALFGAAGAPQLGEAILQIALIAGGLLAVTRFLLPVLFRMATASGREAFGLMVLVASLGTAWLASMLGLSMTVGAFLAGLAIDESEFSHQIHAEIRPLRDLLTSLFFISVGLLVQPAVLLPVLPMVVLVGALIVVLKTFGTTIALLAARVPLRVAGTAALGLAQIGEFSFVLGKEGVDRGVLVGDDWQVLLGASVLTMMVSPWLVGAAAAWGDWLARWVKMDRGAEPKDPELAGMSGHVVILGYGAGGRLISSVLDNIQAPHSILELNGTAVAEAAAEGRHIYYADATAPETLRAAGVQSALAVVAVLSDPGATERATRVVRALNPGVPIIVRTRYRLEAERLINAGASMAVAEELEGSLEVMAQMLLHLDVPGNVAEVLVSSTRQAAGMDRTVRSVSTWLPPESIGAAMGQAQVTTHQLGAADWAVGQPLSLVNLRAETGATILAVKRGRSTLTAPQPDWTFAVGDILYLVGDDTNVRLARARLASGGRTA